MVVGSMNWLLFAACILMSIAGWMFGLVAGTAWAVLSVAALLLARRIARRSESPGPLARIPIWQIVAAPFIGLPIGIGIALGPVLFGPGF